MSITYSIAGIPVYTSGGQTSGAPQPAPYSSVIDGNVTYIPYGSTSVPGLVSAYAQPDGRLVAYQSTQSNAGLHRHRVAFHTGRYGGGWDDSRTTAHYERFVKTRQDIRRDRVKTNGSWRDWADWAVRVVRNAADVGFATLDAYHILRRFFQWAGTTRGPYDGTRLRERLLQTAPRVAAVMRKLADWGLDSAAVGARATRTVAHSLVQMYWARKTLGYGRRDPRR